MSGHDVHKGGLSMAFSAAPKDLAPAAVGVPPTAAPGNVDYDINPRKRGDQVEVVYSYGASIGANGCVIDMLCAGAGLGRAALNRDCMARFVCSESDRTERLLGVPHRS